MAGHAMVGFLFEIGAQNIYNSGGYKMKQYRDHYFCRAKAENYPARSVYKLKEIDQRFKLLRSGLHVLDLGAAPGSWSLGASEKIGQKGVVLACDIKTTDVKFPDQVRFVCSDIFDPTEEFRQALTEIGPFDLVMSDMAPSTTGNKLTDQSRSLELALSALQTATANLRDNGNFIVKIFMGPDVRELLTAMRPAFRNVKSFKPKSSRSESKETFYIGLGYTGQNVEGRL